MNEKMTYEEAVAQIEEIIAQIEAGELGIDILTEKIKVAQQLIKFCKKKLFKTDAELKKLLDNDSK